MTDNERIATELLGWKWIPERRLWISPITDYLTERVPEYDHDWFAASLVIAALNRCGWYVDYLGQSVTEHLVTPDYQPPWHCELWRVGVTRTKGHGRTLPQAIVAATIKVLDRKPTNE